MKGLQLGVRHSDLHPLARRVRDRHAPAVGGELEGARAVDVFVPERGRSAG